MSRPLREPGAGLTAARQKDYIQLGWCSWGARYTTVARQAGRGETSMVPRWSKPLLVVLALVAAACGDDDDDGESADTGVRRHDGGRDHTRHDAPPAPRRHRDTGGATTAPRPTALRDVRRVPRRRLGQRRRPYEANQPAGANWRLGLEMAVAEINEAGGILGLPDRAASSRTPRPTPTSRSRSSPTWPRTIRTCSSAPSSPPTPSSTWSRRSAPRSRCSSAPRLPPSPTARRTVTTTSSTARRSASTLRPTSSSTTSSSRGSRRST